MIMKHLLLTVFLLAAGTCFAQSYRPVKDCKITKSYGMMTRTWRLSGNVKIITDPKEFADLRVKIVDSAASISVKIVTYTPGECGEWRWATDKNGLQPKFTIRIVDDESYDFTVRFVGPGEMPGSR
jgi:hypothetical protein